MGFTEFNRVKRKLQSCEHADVLDSEIDVENEQVTFHVQTSVADDLADKAHNYLVQTIRAEAFPTDTLVIEELSEQEYQILAGVGVEDSVGSGELVRERDPVTQV